MASQCSNGVLEDEASSLQIGPQNSTPKINKSILLPTLRLRLQSLQIACLHNSPECGLNCDPFPDKNLSMFCPKLFGFKYGARPRMGKLTGPLQPQQRSWACFSRSYHFESPSSSPQLPSAAREKHTYHIKNWKVILIFLTQ